MYDVIIVGARCAGSPTAMLLARKGYKVLLVDRDTFPSDIMSTHFVQDVGIRHLDAWGLLDAVRATNAPPINKLTLRLGELAFSPPREEGAPEAVYCPRRTVLDKILVDAAIAAGAELREGVSVQNLLRAEDRVSGIRARTPEGALFEESARMVIGADGMHSLVAKQVQAPKYNEHPALTCGYYNYWSNVPLNGTELCMNADAKTALLAFPTNDALTCIAVMRPIDNFHNYRNDVDANFRRGMDAASPFLAEIVRTNGGKPEERYIGTAQTQNFYCKPYGAGWALVGDAGYHRDPVTGLGIGDAFRDAQLLADAIDAGFAGRAPLDEALAVYEQQRNGASAADYERTIALAKFPSAEELIQGMQAAAPA